MPADDVGTFFGPVLDLIGYWTARLLFPVVSLGWIRVERLSEHVQMTRWHGFEAGPHGIWIVPGPAAGNYGLLFWAFFMAAALAIYIVL